MKKNASNSENLRTYLYDNFNNPHARAHQGYCMSFKVIPKNIQKVSWAFRGVQMCSREFLRVSGRVFKDCFVARYAGCVGLSLLNRNKSLSFVASSYVIYE